MGQLKPQFGATLRATRVAKGYSLRKFAELIEVSPTYLSLVETGKAEYPPSAEKVRVMAESLGENADEWIAMAGRMPADLKDIIKNAPTEMPALLRAAKSMTPDEIRKLTQRLEKKHGKDDTK